MFFARAIATFLLAAATSVLAEQHTVRMINRCGYGTPRLVRSGRIVSTGGEYTANEAILGARAYLQTGSCIDPDGVNCLVVELTLKDPNCPGCGSSVDLSMIPPLKYSVPTSFQYYNGCTSGASCNNPNCPDVFRKPDDYFAQRQCQANGVDLEVVFC